MDWSALEGFLLVRLGWAPSTVEARCGQLRYAERAGLDLDAFTLDAGDRFLAELLRRRISSTGYNNYIVALSGIARFHGLRPVYDKRRVPKAYRRWLDDDQVVQLLTYRHPVAETDLLHRALLLFALNSALRPSEAQRLNLRNVNEEIAGVLVDKTSKFGARRVIPLDTWMWHPKRPFGAYLRWRRALERDVHVDALGPDPLWVTRDVRGRADRPYRRMTLQYVYEALRQIGRDTHVRLNWTICRRSRLTELGRDRGWGLHFVQRLAGHNSPNTTMQYLDLRDEDVFAEMRRRRKKDPFQPPQGGQ